MSNIELAKRVYELNEQSKKIEKELSELKEALKAQGSGKYGEYVVLIEERERENFKLKDAKASVTEDFWAKIKGFVSVTQYQQVKVVKS